MELKSPSRVEADSFEAYTQIKNYMQTIPSLFIYNAICVISDQVVNKAGTITSTEDRFMEWKTADGIEENKDFAQFETFYKGIFDKNRLIDIIKNFICFSNDNGEFKKILSGYHQYFAVNKAIESTINATNKDGRAGVFWHTQGSGKSLSMVFYAQLLKKALGTPTIVVITDRNDLDEQLHGQFARCQDFLMPSPIRAESRKNLKELLEGRKVNGIIFTTMQKFEEAEDALSTCSDIILIADEAHRSQYGLKEKINPTTGKVQIGTARIIRNNLPNATFIGFTGTPISKKDKNTVEVFGDYIDIYDMTQAVIDGATRPIFYESRVIKLSLDKEVLKQIDEKYEELAEIADEHVIEQSKRELSKMDALLGSDETINSLVEDIISHYENHREHLLTGKALVVAYSRPIAIKIYQKILELRPHWQDKVAAVMTHSNKDPEEWGKIIGTKYDKMQKAISFKDNNSPLKIAIVVDMWLTGFDVPSLATMYVYKPMVGHNLVQAITRVNRVFKEKEGGLVIDYIGIASALRQAMNDYTPRDKENFQDPDIKKTAYKTFLEKLEICRDLFHGYDYANFNNASNLELAQLINGAVNFIIAQEKEKDREAFLKASLAQHQAFTLCSSLINAEDRFESSFFDAIRAYLLKLLNIGTGKKLSLHEINSTINEMLKQSIKSDGILNLFSDVKEEMSLFDAAFLAEIANMKEKNLAVELLKRLIAEQVSVYKRTNLVKSTTFSELFQNVISRYLKGLLTNEEVIKELLKLAEEIRKSGTIEGLTEEEQAFYDALAKPQAVKDFYKNKELIALTKELTETLRKNKTIDWNKKESARAGMRKLIKRLLKQYKYPPDDADGAVDIVISQCELWTDNIMKV